MAAKHYNLFWFQFSSNLCNICEGCKCWIRY